MGIHGPVNISEVGSGAMEMIRRGRRKIIAPWRNPYWGPGSIS
jgi:hypothetical protein